MHTLLHLVPPPLQQATTNPCLCWRLLDTHGQVWVSLLWGHCSFLLGPGVHKFLFVPSKSLFPQSCVSSGGSMVELMATSSKRAYVWGYVYCPGYVQGHPEPLSLQQSAADPYLLRKYSQFWSQSLWVSGSWYIQAMFESFECLW